MFAAAFEEATTEMILSTLPSFKNLLKTVIELKDGHVKK